ncbi:MAG: hypothetical protein GY859_35540 [Desulfobacterales bacterium]|nr:hypothetical protein [Desulfobacterales bacterium]
MPVPREMDAPPKTGRYEKIGLWYFYRLSNKNRQAGYISPFDATDDELVRAVDKITIIGSIIAFVIGGVAAGGTVYTELLFSDQSILVKYAWVAAAAILLTAVELAVLFWISVRAVFLISRVTGHDIGDPDKPMETPIPNLLARAALEIPDPVMEFMGVNPLARVSRKKMLMVGAIYKLKIVMSNVLARMILKRLVGKSALRASVAYISVIITGVWNAVVYVKVVREARLRLFGNLIAEHLVDQILTDENLSNLSPAARIGSIQAVANSIVIAQRNHPNMMILLKKLSELFRITEGENLDSWEHFLETLQTVSKQEKYFLLDLLCISTAFDARISGLEKKLAHQAFGEHTEIYFKRIYRLKKLLLKGRLHEAIKECKLDFEPG